MRIPRFTRLLPALGPGIAMVIALAATARIFASYLPDVISEVTVGLVIGLVVAQVWTLPEPAKPGLKFSTGTLLRVGIVLLGARLDFADVFATGAGALVMIVVCMASALALVIGVGRALSLPPRLVVLIGVGTAVCGNSAILATAPVIDADDREVSFAIATITVTGTIALLLYPVIGHLAGLTDQVFGHWAGLAINDTSQVTAAGFAYSPAAGETATIVKLTRNTFIGPLILLISVLYARRTRGSQSGSQINARWVLNSVPTFVFGFLAMAAINTVFTVPDFLTIAFAEASKGLILGALVAIGLTSNVTVLRSVGLRPFYLGSLAALTVAALAYLLTGVLLDS